MRWLDRLARASRSRSPSPRSMAAAFEAASREATTRPRSPSGSRSRRRASARAQNNIGACFAEGLGVERDPTLAVGWLALAAEAQRSGRPAQSRRRSISRAKASSRTTRRAAELYRAAAEQGDAPAQDMLSWMLLEGEVVAPDYAEARRLAQLAAAQGIAASMTRLGMIFHNALGVERDALAAARLVAQGARRAAMPTGRRCSAPPTISAAASRAIAVAAFAWLMRARDGGSTLAKQFFEAVARRAQPEEVAEAERRATEPLPEPVP